MNQFENHIQIAGRCGRDWTFSLHQPAAGSNCAPDPQQEKGHIRASLWTPAADTRSGTGRGKLVPLPSASEREHRVKSTGPWCNRWRENYIGRCLHDVSDDACSVLFCAGNIVEITKFTQHSRLASAPLGLRWRFLGEGPGELLVAD